MAEPGVAPPVVLVIASDDEPPKKTASDDDDEVIPETQDDPEAESKKPEPEPIKRSEVVVALGLIRPEPQVLRYVPGDDDDYPEKKRIRLDVPKGKKKEPRKEPLKKVDPKPVVKIPPEDMPVITGKAVKWMEKLVKETDTQLEKRSEGAAWDSLWALELSNAMDNAKLPIPEGTATRVKGLKNDLLEGKRTIQTEIRKVRRRKRSRSMTGILW